MEGINCSVCSSPIQNKYVYIENNIYHLICYNKHQDELERIRKEEEAKIKMSRKIHFENALKELFKNFGVKLSYEDCRTDRSEIPKCINIITNDYEQGIEPSTARHRFRG